MVDIVRRVNPHESRMNRSLFAGRQFLNSYCMGGLEDRHKDLRDVFTQAVARIQA